MRPIVHFVDIGEVVLERRYGMKKILCVFTVILVFGFPLASAARLFSVSRQVPVIIDGCGYFDEDTGMWVKVKCG